MQHLIDNHYSIIEFFEHKPMWGCIIGLGLTCLGFIDIDINHTVSTVADAINPWFMLLRDLGIGIGVLISLITLRGQLLKKSNGKSGE